MITIIIIAIVTVVNLKIILLTCLYAISPECGKINQKIIRSLNYF